MTDRHPPPWEAAVSRRRERIRAQVESDRRGGHTVPTWVLTVVLAGIVCGWLAIVIWG